jgi:hypothetical protein
VTVSLDQKKLREAPGQLAAVRTRWAGMRWAHGGDERRFTDLIRALGGSVARQGA